MPLPAKEALWVAWMIGPGVAVAGRTASGEPLLIVRIDADQNGDALLVADAIESKDGPRVLDASSLTVATTPDELERNQLLFEVTRAGRSPADRIGLVLGTVALYAAVSGLPAPEATVAADAYGGWRLP